MENIIFTKKKNAKKYRIRIKPDKSIHVTIPKYGTKFQAHRFVQSQSEWIRKQLIQISHYQTKNTDTDIESLRKKAKEYIPQRVNFLATKYGFTYKEIRIKNIRSRWGSCSTQKNLNFSLHLMNLEKTHIDYVILHELCHTIHMNHSKKFWDEVERVCPNYKQIENDMKKFGTELL